MENENGEISEEKPVPIDSTNYFKNIDGGILRKFVACKDDKLRLLELQKLVHVSNYDNNPRSEILVDLLFGICNFCVDMFCLGNESETKIEKEDAMEEEKDENKADEIGALGEENIPEGYRKMATIVSILAEVVESSFGGNISKMAERSSEVKGIKVLSSKESFTLLKELFMAKCINDPNKGYEEVLDMETVNKTITFLSKTFFRYYNAYKYAFKYDQTVIEVERDVLVQFPLPPTSLSLGKLTEELKVNKMQEVQIMQEESQEVNENE